mmetsp:Transcript_85196/g.244582  ORF Transcript_85196/g.244582 Transcript_85196/m.244582 type:complete len:220 (-) Transcript_85196:133-792(-)|eukprot:CAMPEP_0177180634 /NCGR_PEP_ID=MMETSP0367-20130122/15497_1 /TAXON_ID=447022 ORGANISM="Scrippsiella hangoei-like, Strain SHHI-4" /NCGR_SAMPLE_ID=MMETSP0367 /ASSEMBLY_ACC=CAM_ASM_000362 /LENGTH=219 /DNA_ID=CAMNT_0018627433 /DNA_START=78 /DNA_END=737 /DNA_ORIENTATION=+
MKAAAFIAAASISSVFFLESILVAAASEPCSFIEGSLAGDSWLETQDQGFAWDLLGEQGCSSAGEGEEEGSLSLLQTKVSILHGEAASPAPLAVMLVLGTAPTLLGGLVGAGADGVAAALCMAGPIKLEEPFMLVVSFMLLRITVVLRSLYEGSSSIFWAGLLFACMTRYLSGTAVLAPSLLEAPLASTVVALLMSGAREFLHLYGIRMVLSRFQGCEA